MKLTLLFILFISTQVFSQEPVVYKLNWYEQDNSGGTIHFISISDQYRLNEHEDSLAIPSEHLGASISHPTEYIKLNNEYRQRCLKALNITENDVVFIYDFDQDKLLRFYVRGLNLIAVLNPYSNGIDYPISQYDYMIGFQITPSYLKSFETYHDHVMVSIGKTNPFTQGKVKAIVWSKIDSSLFPNNTKLQKNNIQFGKGSPSETYQFNLNDMNIYVQNIRTNGNLNDRHVVAINVETKTIIFEQFYRSSEGGDLTALNGVDVENGEYINQFAGQLFKGMPPVIFGFLYQSFGCPGIHFIGKAQQSIYINCDNRH